MSSKVINKYTSLNPGVQFLFAVLLLAVIFTLGTLFESTYKPVDSFNIGTKPFLFHAGATLNLIGIALMLILFSEGIMLLKRKIKHQTLKSKTAISDLTVALMGSYAAALCLIYGDLLTGMWIKVPMAHFMSALQVLLTIISILLVFLSAFKIIIYFNRKEELNGERIND